MQEHARKVFVQDSWQTPRNARTLAAYMALRNREIGGRIAALRQSRGNPPQEVVAQKLNVAHRSYQAWEAGDTKPSWRNLTRLAEYFDVTEEYILVGDRGPELETPDLSLAPSLLERQVRELLVEISQLGNQIRGLEEQVRLLRAEAATRDAEVLTQISEVRQTIRDLRGG